MDFEKIIANIFVFLFVFCFLYVCNFFTAKCHWSRRENLDCIQLYQLISISANQIRISHIIRGYC